MNQETAKFDYALLMGDNALIIGHRLSEWCGHGPVLEQDIAITNIALDQVGQARSWLSLAGELEGQGKSEDDLAYFRDARAYKNALLTEQPNTDWAYTIVRQFIFDTYNFYLHQGLTRSTFQPFADIAEKSLKEVAYHIRYSSEWVIRLGDGTELSHQKIQQALDDLWLFAEELVTPNPAEAFLIAEGVIPDPDEFKSELEKYREQILEEATLKKPQPKYWKKGGKEGLHSEHLGFILAEMQSVQRAYPGLKW